MWEYQHNRLIGNVLQIVIRRDNRLLRHQISENHLLSLHSAIAERIRHRKVCAMTADDYGACGCEIFILAGGLSLRMGRDKSGVRLGRRTLLQHVRGMAGKLGYPVRVVRRDAVPRSGPIGGIYTGLKRSRAETVLFLACDMPLVSPGFLRKLVGGLAAGKSGRPIGVFAREGARTGFPFILRREAALPIVSEQIARGEFSLQKLAGKIRAKSIGAPKGMEGQLANINTPGDLERFGRKESVARRPRSERRRGRSFASELLQ